MHARSALFDLYGDHLRSRGDQAPVSALVRLLSPVGVSAPAVRTAVSRLVAQGWLSGVALPSGPGYRATDQAVRRLDRAADRIYRITEREWDGQWHLVLLDPIPSRPQRTRLRSELTWVGFAELAERTWVSPWPHPEVAEILARAGVGAATATARDFAPPDRPAAAWDLPALAARYSAWLAEVDAVVAAHLADHPDDPDEASFAARFHLVHGWRKFLFSDPGLPDLLLPDPWPGTTAARHFAELAGRLEPGTIRFVDRCLGRPER